MNKPIISVDTMPRGYRTKEQWDIFIQARKVDIEELKRVIEVAKELKKSL